MPIIHFCSSVTLYHTTVDGCSQRREDNFEDRDQKIRKSKERRNERWCRVEGKEWKDDEVLRKGREEGKFVLDQLVINVDLNLHEKFYIRIGRKTREGRIGRKNREEMRGKGVEEKKEENWNVFEDRRSKKQ